MESLYNYIILDNTPHRKISRIDYPEQATKVELLDGHKRDDGSILLTTALLGGQQFIDELRKDKAVNKKKPPLTNNFFDIVERICELGRLNPQKLHAHNKFFLEYNCGMRVLYDRMLLKKFDTYSCEVNFKHYRQYSDEVVTRADYLGKDGLFKRPAYFNYWDYAALCNDTGNYCPIEMFSHIEASRKIVKGVRRSDALYNSYKEHLGKGRRETYADVYSWGTGLFARRSIAKQMHGDKIPAIADPSFGGKQYATLNKFFDDKGFVCSIPITSVMRDPAALFNALQEETYDSQTKRARYGHTETERYADWLANKAETTKTGEKGSVIIPINTKTGFDNRAEIG